MQNYLSQIQLENPCLDRNHVGIRQMSFVNTLCTQCIWPRHVYVCVCVCVGLVPRNCHWQPTVSDRARLFYITYIKMYTSKRCQSQDELVICFLDLGHKSIFVCSRQTKYTPTYLPTTTYFSIFVIINYLSLKLIQTTNKNSNNLTFQNRNVTQYYLGT